MNFVSINKVGVLLIALLWPGVLPLAICQQALPAFPGAEGFGSSATGGRGGQVVFVTNLHNDGEGSFRWAVEQFPGEPLTVLFRVGGIIELSSKIVIKRSNLTIAGQSAPGEGICFKGHSLILNGAAAGGNHGNIIMRYIRSRPGGNLSTGLYGFDMENCHDVIIDHCSFSWANEECAAMYDTRFTTVQWCIISEALYNANHMKGKRGYGGVWGGQFASYHHNLFAHLQSRAIRFNGARAHDTTALVDYRNNVVYNWANTNACYGGEVHIEGGRSQVNMVSNYYKPGPATASQKKWVHATYQPSAAKGIGQWFAQGNVMEAQPLLNKNNAMGIDVSELPEAYRRQAIVTQPFSISASISTQSASKAYRIVLKEAGAIFPIRDAVDARVVNEVATNKPAAMGSYGKAGIIDDPIAVGGWPIYRTAAAPLDSDMDGMPDEWEKLNGLNPFDATDRNKIHASGYTMLERYLNQLVLIKK